jgi:hypothetical protein
VSSNSGSSILTPAIRITFHEEQSHFTKARIDNIGGEIQNKAAPTTPILEGYYEGVHTLTVDNELNYELIINYTVGSPSIPFPDHFFDSDLEEYQQEYIDPSIKVVSKRDINGLATVYFEDGSTEIFDARGDSLFTAWKAQSLLAKYARIGASYITLDDQILSRANSNMVNALMAKQENVTVLSNNRIRIINESRFFPELKTKQILDMKHGTLLTKSQMDQKGIVNRVMYNYKVENGVPVAQSEIQQSYHDDRFGNRSLLTETYIERSNIKVEKF